MASPFICIKKQISKKEGGSPVALRETALAFSSYIINVEIMFLWWHIFEETLSYLLRGVKCC